MGFDPECILHPEQVPGEYYCPLCRQLVHPAEVQQTLCGHLFCRPCVTYIVGTTGCCPYENHPINDGEPKNLQETNPQVFEAIGCIAVRCLFHKSGCVWQGLLSDSAAHSASCGYGNSPVYCNRCGAQILHRQVQEHAQTCTVMTQYPAGQVQQAPGSQTDQSQAQPGVPQQFPAGVQAQAAPITQAQGAHAQVQVPQNSAQQAPGLADQWYQQQYQQYYQQYAQYQQYQQYEQYQQQQQQQQVPVEQQVPVAQQYVQAHQQPYPMQQPVAQPSQAVQQQPFAQPHPVTQPQPHHPMAQAIQQAQHPQLAQPQPHPQQQPFPQQPHHQPPQFQQPQPQQQAHPQQMQHQQQAHLQQMHHQQVHPFPGKSQPFQTQPLAHPQQPHQQPPQFQQPPFQPHSHQAHLPQPQPQQPIPHQQQPFQQQPPQAPQVPLQVQHPGIPSQSHPLQQNPPWEQHQQPQPQPTGWAQDGIGQVQAVQDPFVISHYAGMHSMHQQAHWQGKNLAGQAVNPLARQHPHGFQQPRPSIQPSPQPPRQGILHAPPNHVVPGQAVPSAAQGLLAPKPGPVPIHNANKTPRSQPIQPGQAFEKAPGLPSQSQPGLHRPQDPKTSQAPGSVGEKDALKTSGSNASEVVGKSEQKGDEDKSKQSSAEPAVSKGGSAVHSPDNKEQTQPENIGAQDDTKEEESEAKQDAAPPSQVTQSPTKSDESPASQVQQNSMALQQESKQVQPNQSPAQMPQSPNAHKKETLPQTQQNQTSPAMQSNQNDQVIEHTHQPPQARQNQLLPALQQKAPQMLLQLPHQPPQLHQIHSQVPRPGLHQAHHIQSAHQLLHQSHDQMMGMPSPRALIQPQPGAVPFFPAHNPPFQSTHRQPPGEALFGMPPRPPEQRPPLLGQPQQPGFHQRDQLPQWHPSLPGSFMKEAQSPSRIPSPLTPPPLADGPQKEGHPHSMNQSFLPPPPPYVDGAKPILVDQSRHLMEQIAAFENETKIGKNIESGKFSRLRPEDPYLLEAQRRLNQRSTWPESTLQHPGFRDGSPPRASDFIPRFPPGSSLDVLPRAPHPPLGSDMQNGARSAIPSGVAGGLEFFPRSTFPPDVYGGHELGGPHKPLADMGFRSSFPTDTAANLKYPSDAFRPGMSADFARSGPVPEIGSRRTPPHPPHFDSEARSKLSMDMDLRPPFKVDADSRPKFGDMEPQSSLFPDSESRAKFPSDLDHPRPSFHLDNFRSSFPPDNEHPRLHLDGDQRSKFPFDREPRSRFDTDLYSRGSFESRPGSFLEERSRLGFSSKAGFQTGFPHSDMAGGRAEGHGLSTDFLGSRGDSTRGRMDSISSLRSPGRDSSLPSRRNPFSSGWREPSGVPGPFESLHGAPPLHSVPDVGRDNFRFEDRRVKGLDSHPPPLQQDSLNSGRLFNLAGRPQDGGPGPGFPHSYAAHRPPLGFLNGGTHYKSGSFIDDMDHGDFGRKRKQGGSSGWCRICHIDCYTVQGLEEHSKSEEHQKKTLDLVMSIKQDSAKKQKQANAPEVPKKESLKKSPTKEADAKPEGKDDEEDEDDEEEASESD